MSHLNRRAVLASGATLVLPHGVALASDKPSEPTPGLHDLAPDFWRFYDADVGGEAAERALALHLQFISRNIEVYTAAGFTRNGSHGQVTDRRVADWLRLFDPLALAARRVSQMLPDAWREHEVRFRASFPSRDSITPVYVLLSLFAFDADTRPWRGRPCLFLGVDGMVQQAGEPNLDVLLDQEAFHLYHAEANRELWSAPQPPLWMRLWREGLASFVSARLNPKAPAADVLRSPELAEVSPESLRAIAAQALAALDTTDVAGHHRFLDAGYEGDIPVRSGYLLGLRLAERAGRSLSLDQLARLPAVKVHRFMKTELSRIAHG
jgi:hypothetical protein